MKNLHVYYKNSNCVLKYEQFLKVSKVEAINIIKNIEAKGNIITRKGFTSLSRQEEN